MPNFFFSTAHHHGQIGDPGHRLGNRGFLPVRLPRIRIFFPLSSLACFFCKKKKTGDGPKSGKFGGGFSGGVSVGVQGFGVRARDEKREKPFRGAHTPGRGAKKGGSRGGGGTPFAGGPGARKKEYFSRSALLE